jgi:F0F1-type ATP synthase membrane subunit b/b'
MKFSAIIEEALATEEEASRQINEAQRRAKDRLNESEKEASLIVGEAQKKCAAQSRLLFERTSNEIERLKTENETKIANDYQQFIDNSDSLVDKIANKAFNLIIGR